MLWEFGVFFITLLNLAAVWLIYEYPNLFFWAIGIFAAALLVGVKVIARRTRFFLLPFLLTLGSVLLLPLIDSPAQAKAFIVLSCGVFYLAILGSFRLGRYEKDKTAKAMINFATLATLFCWFAAAYGWYMNIVVSIWIIMIIFAVLVFLLTYQSFLVNQLVFSRHQRILYAVFLAYLMAGVVWMQDFWPFGYLTTGVSALIVYYCAWDVIRDYFLDNLTVKKIAFNSVFLAVSLALVLASARWYPTI